jgi:hypothetical protein
MLYFNLLEGGSAISLASLHHMKYGISKIVMGFPGFIDIDEVEYKRIKDARANLFEFLFLEEKLDLVTENFLEYETELLSIACRSMVFHDVDYFTMSRDRNIVSRRIVNLLSACRMYLDQSIHHIKNIYGENSGNVNLVKKEIASQYDQNLGFRVMEALRNYVQHRGFPIHKIQFSGAWLDIESDENSRLLHTIVPLISVSELADDDKFKRTVLKEMLAIQNKLGIDIRPLIRDYMESIGKIHEKVREFIHLDVKEWESILNDTINKFQREFGAEESLAGLAIVAKKDDSHWVESKTIFMEFIEKRRALENKNRFFVNLHKCYASNEIQKKEV